MSGRRRQADKVLLRANRSDRIRSFAPLEPFAGPERRRLFARDLCILVCHRADVPRATIALAFGVAPSTVGDAIARAEQAARAAGCDPGK